MVIFIFFLIFNITYGNKCTLYGPLSHGALSWGLTSNHHTASGSITNSNNGSETIQSFITIFDRFPTVTYICFIPKRLNCSFNITNDCIIYGPLYHGVFAWGIDYDRNQIPGSGQSSNTGSETIDIFTLMFNIYSNMMALCFCPKKVNC